MNCKNFTVILLAVFCLLILSKSSYSQNAAVNFTLAYPQGEFKRNVDRVGYGGSANLMFWDVSPSIPFSLGVNAGFITYGSEQRNEPFSTTIPDVTVDVNRSNNIVNFHLLLQVMPPLGGFRPYIEGLLGGSYLYTNTEIRSEGFSDKEVASSTNFSDWAWSYGGGGGLMFKVFENDKASSEKTQVTTVWIDLKARYLLGTEAEYLKEGSVKINNGKVSYDVSKSKTDLITGHIGVVIYFR